MRFVDEQNQVIAILYLVDDAFDALFKHAAQHRAGHDSTHLQLHDVRVSQTRGNFLRLEFDQAGQAFYDRRFAHAWFANEHRRIGALAMAGDFDYLLNFFFAADGRRNLVRPRHPIQRNSEVLQIRRQLKLFAVLFVLFLALVHAGAHVFDDGFRFRAQLPQHLDEQSIGI